MDTYEFKTTGMCEYYGMELFQTFLERLPVGIDNTATCETQYKQKIQTNIIACF